MNLLKEAIPLYGMTVEVQRPPRRSWESTFSVEPSKPPITYPPYPGIVRGAWLDGSTLMLIVEHAETGDLSTPRITHCKVIHEEDE